MFIYLYIKQHSITGLKYFGVTTSNKPKLYKGSGSIWKEHIKEHGSKHVKTLQLWKFDNQEECIEFALTFSEENNIVKSPLWANRYNETGYIGTRCGVELSEEIKNKISDSISGENHPFYGIKGHNHPRFGIPHTEQTKEKMRKSHALRDTTKSIETRRKLSKALTGNKHSEETKSKISKSLIGHSNNKGHIFSEQHKLNMRKPRSEICKVTCPHCSKVGVPGNMNRWHFDNCKLKI